jgi:Na+/H+-dicarboxylate symporter
MPKLISSARSLIKHLIWHFLMGIVLGILCAGLMLQIDAAHSAALVHGGDSALARLRFLLIAALFFGVGATVTGAALMVNEKQRPQSRR